MLADSGWPYSLPRLGWAGPWRTANRALIPRSMWRMRSRDSIRKLPGSCEVSSLERLAELQRGERDKILNFATRTKMSLASVSGTGSSNPSPSSGESANFRFRKRATARLRAHHSACSGDVEPAGGGDGTNKSARMPLSGGPVKARGRPSRVLRRFVSQPGLWHDQRDRRIGARSEERNERAARPENGARSRNRRRSVSSTGAHH